MEKKVTLRDLGLENAEKALVQTGLAYHYHNPYCQYNLLRRITADGQQLATREMPPEFACREIAHYENCRGLVSDIYWNTLNTVVPGTRMSWHPVADSALGKKMQVFKMVCPDRWDATPDYEARVQELLDTIRPGDIMMSDKKSGSHVMMYMGECLGDGKRYVIHDWPVGGGTMNMETGINKREPGGSAILETVEDLWYPGTGKPSWKFAPCFAVYVFRPLKLEQLLDREVPLPTLSRLKYPHLCIQKDAGVQIYDTVLPGQQFTITLRIANKGQEDYKDLEVVEYIPDEFILDRFSNKLNGKTGGVVKMVNDIQAVTWRLNIPAGKEYKLSFDVKVRKKNGYAGKTITQPSGTVDNIPTRALTFKTGAKKFTEEELAAMKALTVKKSELPEKLMPKTFRDLDFVNIFYKTVLSMKLNLPKSMDEFVKKTMFPCDNFSECDWSKMVCTLESLDREDQPEDVQHLLDMRIHRYLGGAYVWLEGKREDRAFDYLEEYFTPGDVFMVAGGEKNTVSAGDKANVSIYIYLGNGTVLSHKKSGTTRETFENTIGSCLLNNIIIGIRPTLTEA